MSVILKEAREGDVHRHLFGDAPATATEKYTNSNVRELSHKDEKRKLRDDEKEDQGTRELLNAPTHHAGQATIPSSLLHVGSLRRLDCL